VDTANLGHFHATGDTVVQTVRLAWPYNKMGCDHVADSWIYGTPAIWEGPDATHVYVWGSFDYLRDYKLNDSGQFSTQGICFCPPGWTLNDESKTFTIEVSDPPCAVLSTMNAEHVDALTGAGMSVSSNGKVPGTGIVWATRPGPGDPVSQSIPGVLEAYDATYLATPLWSSATNAARDNLGSWAKFVQPTIANGKVYMATQSNQLVVYGLLPAK
jgi:hypothetical protein